MCCVYLATSQAQPISTVQYYFRLQRGDEDDAELPRVAVGRGRAADGEGARFELRFPASLLHPYCKVTAYLLLSLSVY